MGNGYKVLRKSLKSQFSYKQHRIFIARSLYIRIYDQQAKDIFRSIEFGLQEQFHKEQ